MREVISIDKDYTNKTQSEHRTLKPKSNMVGKVKVTLLDEKENVVREIFTENAIMDINNYSNYLSYLDMTTGGNFKHTSFSLSNMSEYLYLLNIDSNYKVSPNKCVLNPFDYTEVGYCGKKEVFTGQSEKKGSYNSNESKIYIDENKNVVYRYVYDFPANCGNGTINAIGFGSGDTLLYGPIKSESTSILTIVDRSSRVSNSYDDGLYVYCIKRVSPGFSLYRYSKFEGSNKFIKNVTASDSNSTMVYRFNSTKKYIVGVRAIDKTSVIIQKFDLLGELISEETITVSEPILNGGTSYVKSIIDDNEDFLYVLDYSRVHVFNVKNDYSFISTINIQDDDDDIGSSSYVPYSIHCDNDFFTVCYRNKSSINIVKYFSKNDFKVKHKLKYSQNSFLCTNAVTYNNSTTAFATDYNYCYASGIVMSTLTKLPSDIIKTDKYAMKVQYEIVYTPAKIEDFI